MPASAKKTFPGLLIVTSCPSRDRVSDSPRAIGARVAFRSSGMTLARIRPMNRATRLLSDIGYWSLGHRTTRISRRALSGFMTHEALQYAGSMAYFAVLSIFQLLVLGIVI